MLLAEKIRDDIWSSHAKIHEFNIHRDEDINLSLFSFYEFCTLKKQELGRIDYMKDVVKKLNLYFSDLYFIFYEFSNLMNGQV
jgi:hypothetical protein